MTHCIFRILLFVLAVTFPGWNGVYAQKAKQEIKTEKEVAVKKMIQDKRHVFIAQSAMPLSGRNRQLSPGYDVKVSADSIIAYIPYFGRAYSAPINTSDGSIKFTATKFQYSVTERSKGGWDITIKPKGLMDVQQLFLTVFRMGSLLAGDKY